MEYHEFTTSEAVKKASEADHLNAREKHLIGIAVAATRGCIMCSTSRIRSAMEDGITREAVIQAVDLAAQINAGVTVATALQGAQRARVDDDCASGACEPPKTHKS